MFKSVAVRIRSCYNQEEDTVLLYHYPIFGDQGANRAVEKILLFEVGSHPWVYIAEPVIRYGNQRQEMLGVCTVENFHGV